MRFLQLVLLSFPFLLVHASPTRVSFVPTRTFGNTTRQAVVTPKPCELKTPEPSEADSSAVFDKFVDAFLVKKNLTEAFSYIDAGYIVGPPTSHFPHLGPRPLLSAPLSCEEREKAYLILLL